MEDAFNEFMEFIHGKDFLGDEKEFQEKLWKCEEHSVTIIGAVEQMNKTIGYQNIVSPTGQVTPVQLDGITGQPVQTTFPQRESKPRVELTPLLVVLVVAVLSIVGFLAYMNYSDAQAQINYLQSAIVNGTRDAQQAKFIQNQIAGLNFRQDQLMRSMVFLTGVVVTVISAPKILDIIGHHARKTSKETPYPPVREWMQERFSEIREKYTSAIFLVQLQDQDVTNLGESWTQQYTDAMVYSRKEYLLKTLRSEFSTALGEIYQVAEAIIYQRIENVQQGSIELSRTYASQKGSGVG